MSNKENPNRSVSWIDKPWNVLDGTVATVDWDSEFGNVGYLVLSGNVTLGPIDGKKKGDKFTLIVVQDGVGGHALTFDASFKFAGGTAPTITVAAAAKDIITFTVDADGNANCDGVQQNLS